MTDIILLRLQKRLLLLFKRVTPQTPPGVLRMRPLPLPVVVVHLLPVVVVHLLPVVFVHRLSAEAETKMTPPMAVQNTTGIRWVPGQPIAIRNARLETCLTARL